ncbi:MFS transporter [Algoriphagus halophilus]|uniref:Nitrate/nitrite transporter NarK n=1 Tax=Algoriphagus halophilus TaxID=226505 RepID=A0A1N6E8M8_9BACT|nr:MFS transporter [Algoriphagus halophilus]SIN79363.1 Nitrate/nitrite transporter NarK [Algoriphagus halophilus]
MKLISSRSALILIVIAQFLGTSLWFAGNAVAPEIGALLGEPELIASITSTVQFGFIIGTFFYAFFAIPDRFPPGDVFFFSAVLAACFNILVVLLPFQLPYILFCRFLVGFFLAGIYPVGMKIAADYFEKGLGAALGFLVGALVLGTAFPHLINGLGLQLSWKIIFWITSALAILGGALVGFFVPDGPYRKSNPKFDVSLLPKLSKINALKSAASGYFGHMWELYTFWAFAPMVIAFLSEGSFSSSKISLLSFSVIAIGGISCAVGGVISQKTGSKKVALFSLLGSGVCCIFLVIAPSVPSSIWMIFLLIWGILVTADSPQFSTLVSQSVPAEFKGTALTLVNSMGFALSIVSIQFAQLLLTWLPIDQALALLVVGPLTGILLFRFFAKKKRPQPEAS